MLNYVCGMGVWVKGERMEESRGNGREGCNCVDWAKI